MSDVIDFGAERDKREGPDPDYRMKDDFGREMFMFLLSYEMDGGGWSIQIWAYSAEDAEARVTAMRNSLRLDGQIYTAIQS